MRDAWTYPVRVRGQASGRDVSAMSHLVSGETHVDGVGIGMMLAAGLLRLGLLAGFVRSTRPDEAQAGSSI